MFIGKHNGQYVTAPGGYGGQCVDLCNVFLIEERHQQPVRANAIDWSHVTIPGMSWVANSPSNFPPPGSIVVWGEYPPHGIGPYGHVAVSVLADGMNVLSFDQNYPSGTPCHLQYHDYGGVLGWHKPG
jgi:hypothetical protein